MRDEMITQRCRKPEHKGMILRHAARLAEEYLRRYEAYREECDQAAREGYRPHYCEHGMNLWTDYDPICGWCEDGVTMRDGAQRRRAALDEARQTHETFEALMAATNYLRRHGIEYDGGAFADHIGGLFRRAS